jgi:hypothetical protein
MQVIEGSLRDELKELSSILGYLNMYLLALRSQVEMQNTESCAELEPLIRSYKGEPVLMQELRISLVKAIENVK